jgi:hypothetical protein
MRALLREVKPRHSDKEVDQLVQIRLRRKELLARAEEPLRLHAVIDESVLRRVVGSTEIMRLQLEAIIESSKRSNVTVQVFPFTVGAHEAMMGMFTVFQFADDIDRDVVDVESHLGYRYLEQEFRVLLYLRIFDSVSHKSLEPAPSRDFIHQIAQDYSRTTGTANGKDNKICEEQLLGRLWVRRGSAIYRWRVRSRLQER